MPLLFPKSFQKATPKSTIQPLTLKGFGGGLNAVDDDFSMEPRYAKTLINFRRTPSGGQQVRFGSNWFADVKNAVSGTILDKIYFNGRLIVVMNSGEIATVTDSGVVAAGWNSSIASTLPGSPSGWGSAYVAVSFVPFRDTLVIHNGVDKPISISSTFVFTYLQDLATGSNVNVPIGKYGTVAQNYHCIAGIPALPTTIFISAVGAAGVFPGDPAPNDSISIDVGAYSPQGAVTIRGLAGYRNFLIVFFQGQALLVTLGNYDANGVHKPQFPDTLPKFGLLGQRCLAPVEHDLIFTGLDGYSDAKRNLFSGLVTSDHVSDRIEPLYRKITGNLTDAQQQNSCFLVHDPLWHDTILFTPSGTHFVHTGSENLHYSAWSVYNFPTAWTCACTSFLGRVFYSFGTRIFQHGNAVFDGEDYNADRLNDRDVYWTPLTVFNPGQLVRDDSMNLAYMSNSFSTNGINFSWAPTNCTIVTNVPIGSPDPHNNSWLWQRSSTALAFYGQVPIGGTSNIHTAGTPTKYTYSIYVAPGLGGTPARYASVYISDQSPDFQGTVQAVFDMTTGTVTQLVETGNGPNHFTNLSASIVTAPFGFFRISVTFTTTANSSELRPFFSGNMNNSLLLATDSAADTTLIVYGIQVEQRDRVGAYAPTTTKQILASNNKTYTPTVMHASGGLSFFLDTVNNPTLWTQYKGLPISFEMELPWLSGKDPMKVKQLRFASVGTLGSAEFTLEVYADRLFNGFNPGLSLPFIGGDAAGFGFDAGPFGGGRRSDDPRLYGFPLKFKLLKLRFIGASTKPLQIVNTSFLFSRGKYKR